MFNKEKIINDYDDLAYESREGGVSYQSIITALTDDYAGKFKNTTVSGLDVPELIYDSIRFHVQTTRNSRRQDLKRMFEALGDKLESPAGSKPYVAAERRLRANVQRAFPLGDETGTDKALGMWAIDDVKNAKKSREENLAKQRIATEQFNAAADRAIDAIGKGVRWDD